MSATNIWKTVIKGSATKLRKDVILNLASAGLKDLARGGRRSGSPALVAFCAKGWALCRFAEKLCFWVAQRFQRCCKCSRISEGFSR